MQKRGPVKSPKRLLRRFLDDIDSPWPEPEVLIGGPPDPPVVPGKD